jgi:hypothetical protein
MAHEIERPSIEAEISTNASFDTDELTPTERRQYRARNQRMVVVPQVGADDNATGLYNVYTESGKRYVVDDVTENRCSCPDMKHRNPAGGCKHARRVRIMIRETALPAAGEPAGPFFDSCLSEMVSELREEREAVKQREQTLNHFLDGLREEYESLQRDESILTTPEK